MNLPPVVSPEEWTAAREQLLVKEKELTRARDALAAERRRMPRQAVSKEYGFEGPDGPVGLLDLFEGRSQLIVYRFFFEPGVSGWPEGGCRGCSFGADQVGAPRPPERPRHHLRLRLPRAAGGHRPLPRADGLGSPLVHAHRRLRRRLRGRRMARHQRLHPRRRRDLPHLLRRQPRRRSAGGTWSYLDITALGRQEIWEDSPEGYPQTQAYAWWNRHDEYDEPTVFQAALDAQAASQRGERSI